MKELKTCVLRMGIQNGNSNYRKFIEVSQKQNHITIILLEGNYPKELKSVPKRY